MRFSLRLLAERLCRKGHRALAMNERDAYFERVRLMPSLNEPLMPDTEKPFMPSVKEQLEAGVLYVCDCVPETIGLDALCIGGHTPKTPDYDVFRIRNRESETLESVIATDSSTPCLLALTELPPRNWRYPSLVVEPASKDTVLLNAITDVVDELKDAIDKIEELAWEEKGLTKIVEALSRLLGNPVYIVDSSFKVMAITDDPDMEEMSVNWMNAARRGYLSYDVISNLIRSDELHDIESSISATLVKSEYFYTPFANLNLRQKGKVQGHLFVVQMYRTITPGDLELIDAVTPSVLHAMQVDPTHQAHRGPLYENFVVDWLEGSLQDPAYILHQLEALDFNASNLSVAALFTLSVDSEFRRERLARLLEDRQGCRCISRGDQIVALFQLKQRKEKESVLRKIKSICKSQQCRAAVSDVQDSFLDTPRAYRQARETLHICDAMGFADDVVCYGDVAAYQPYLNFSSVEELEAFCHPAVVFLHEYDRVHAVKLLPTLSAFLKNERDVQATATELFVHRNTLMYRINKILDMCPVDLDDFTTRHRLLESILVMENRKGITANQK